MKCPSCGYVSFNDLTHCKKCGVELGAHQQNSREAPDMPANGSRPKESENLFSLDLDGGGLRGDPPEERNAPSNAGNDITPGGMEGEGSEESPSTPVKEQAEPSVTFEDLADVLEQGGVKNSTIPPSQVEEEGFRLSEELVADTVPSSGERAAAGATEEEKVALPDLEVDFDPSRQVTAPAGPTDAEGEEKSTLPVTPVALQWRPAPIIDQADEIPDELWKEERAGSWRRLLAFAIDQTILAAILSLFVGGALVALKVVGVDWSQMATPEGLAAAFVPFYLLGLGLSLSYYTFFQGWIGRTPGKVLLKLEIRRLDGGPLSYTRSFLRWVGYLVSITPAGLGFVWVLVDEKGRGWHDYLSGTRVRYAG